MAIWKYPVSLTLSLILMPACYAHGEDKPGPHNGAVRMPGNYHVEVIPDKDALNVMLLDANFKNPTVLNSSIKVKIKHGRNAYVLRCESMDNYFSCPVNANMLAQKGTLQIESERQQTEGDPVEYPLPLKIAEENQAA